MQDKTHPLVFHLIPHYLQEHLHPKYYSMQYPFYGLVCSSTRSLKTRRASNTALEAELELYVEIEANKGKETCMNSRIFKYLSIIISQLASIRTDPFNRTKIISRIISRIIHGVLTYTNIYIYISQYINQ